MCRKFRDRIAVGCQGVYKRGRISFRRLSTSLRFYLRLVIFCDYKYVVSIRVFGYYYSQVVWYYVEF